MRSSWLRPAIAGSGLADDWLRTAARVRASSRPLTAPVLFYVQSEDDMVSPDACRALFDALGSPDKTLVENPGGHLDLPRSTVAESATWLDERLAEA